MSSALELSGVDKRYPGQAVPACAGAHLSVRAGSIHAVVGENGAGKSTLLGIAAGTVRADAGRLEVDGRELPLLRHSPRAAVDAHIGLVHQHFRLISTLPVVDNVILGREPTRGPFLDRRRAAAEIAELSRKAGLEVDPWAMVADLPLGMRQRVEIVKVLWRGARVLLLDEPTAVLSPLEVASLLEVLRRLAADGTAVVLVTHKLREVVAAADAVTVMRQGKVVAEMTPPIDEAEISRAIVGGAEVPEVIRQPGDPGEVRLAISGLRVPGALDGIDLEVRAGEIVGVAGVQGNGQSELVLALAGLLPHQGKVTAAAGIAHIPEDRHARAAVMDMTVAENLALGRHRERPWFGFGRRALAEVAGTSLAAYDVRPADPEARFASLSGGNQQKVVAARELGRAPLGVVLAAEPTRGVDVLASARIHAALAAAAEAGAGVLLVSSDLAELRRLADRLVVFYRGKIVARLPVAEATDERLGALMTGGAA